MTIAHFKRLVLAMAGVALSSQLLTAADSQAIDRKAWVTRHNVTLTQVDFNSPLSVGNGEFAFTADVTGLQTFEADYNKGIPLSTMSQWGFHTMPNPHGFSVETYPLTMIETRGKPTPYLYYQDGISPKDSEPAASFLYNNPGRIHLGRLAMVLKKNDGHPAALADLHNIRQELNLWTGELVSRFEFEGRAVQVRTVSHPILNQVAAQITSPLLTNGQLSVELAFPYGTASFQGNGADWSKPDAHLTTVAFQNDQADFARRLDSDFYHAAMTWTPGAGLQETSRHHYLLTNSPTSETLEVTLAFSPLALQKKLPDFAATSEASAREWEKYWTRGGAIDLSQSKDPRWKELERRIVLSRYLTRIQCAGSLPPQETGLTCNSWFGKFHLEMHWWHAAHFPLWGNAELLERSLPYYTHILPKAKDWAQKQGYEGARWPKCVGPDGEQGPTYLEPFLIWQQPHPIFYAELCYRAHPDKATLKRYQELVFETAKFMASFAAWDTNRQLYRIGPPFSDAAEVYWSDHKNQFNPGFETAYWRWGLETAQQWRIRQGLPRDAKWDEVIHHLPPLPVRDGLYVAAESATGTFTKPGENTSHPCMVAPLGMLNGVGVDRPTMQRTLHRINENWDWGNTWGWDFPMMAMTAARLGEGSYAIDLLLKDTPKNRFLPNGHNAQMDGILPIYLPGNGGLLYATALMAAGWDGAPKRNAPGFPDDGTWVVRCEGIQPAP